MGLQAWDGDQMGSDLVTKLLERVDHVREFVEELVGVSVTGHDSGAAESERAQREQDLGGDLVIWLEAADDGADSCGSAEADEELRDVAVLVEGLGGFGHVFLLFLWGSVIGDVNLARLFGQLFP